MGDLDMMFVGILLVGVGLSVKVVVDGRAHLDALAKKLETFQMATVACLAQADEEEGKAVELEQNVQTLKGEYEALADREKTIKSKIEVLKSSGSAKNKLAN